MFESILNFFKNMGKKEKEQEQVKSKDTAKERLHLVLMQDRANVSADFLDLMKQEIIEVIKKYIDVDENAIDVRLTNKTNGDGTTGAPALYANIPIVSIKDEGKNKTKNQEEENKQENQVETNNEEDVNEEKKEESIKEEIEKTDTLEQSKTEENVEQNVQKSEVENSIQNNEIKKEESIIDEEEHKEKEQEENIQEEQQNQNKEENTEEETNNQNNNELKQDEQLA